MQVCVVSVCVCLCCALKVGRYGGKQGQRLAVGLARCRGNMQAGSQVGRQLGGKRPATRSLHVPSSKKNTPASCWVSIPITTDSPSEPSSDSSGVSSR